MHTTTVTTQRGVTCPRLPQPPLFLPSNGNPGPPSAANLARLRVVYITG